MLLIIDVVFLCVFHSTQTIGQTIYKDGLLCQTYSTTNRTFECDRFSGRFFISAILLTACKLWVNKVIPVHDGGQLMGGGEVLISVDTCGEALAAALSDNVAHLSPLQYVLC